MYVLLLLLSVPGAFGLSCYSCENERSNFLCINEDNLVECEEGMDTCQTIVSYSDVSAKLSIIKTCTKNVSCELQVNATALSMPCDRSQSSWVCTTCCYENECNVNTAARQHSPSILAWIVLLYSTLQHYTEFYNNFEHILL